MIQRLQILRITIALMLFLAFNLLGFSQEVDSPSMKKPMRHSIGIQVSFHEFFAWHPSIPTGYKVAYFVLDPSFGLEYAQKRIRNRDLWAFSIKLYPFHEYYLSNDPPCTRDGQIFWRIMGLVQGDYFRHLISRRNANLYASLGLTFRYGNEYVTSCIPKWYGEADDFPLRDLGIAIGMRGNLPIGRRILFSGDLKFTEFLLRYTHGIDPWYTNFARHGSTRHMLTLQLGLGYRF